MELANVSSSLCLYATALTSPNPCDRKSLNYLYCSAPVSPRRNKQDKGDFPKSNLVDFEFESSKTFSRKQRYRERGDSLPAVAFVDEVFFSGVVMPLKLPPRLQYNSVFNSSSQRWTFAPRSMSPTTMCRIPFACKYTWNDDFDPFTVALERVREEKRGRSGQPRRSRSHSPFRIASKYSCTDTISCNQDSYEDKSSMKSANQVPVWSYSGPLELKGSAYARWVRDQKKEGLNPREPKNPSGLRFGLRVRPVRNKHDGRDMPASTKGRDAKDKRGNDSGKSRVGILKGLLLKYASFGREKNATKLTKKSVQTQKESYFSRLSFKFRENGKRMLDDETAEVAEYKTSTISCSYY
ncbi:uncharacterized protein [Primulina huaijiensis]|uniref:uncharacterized protein n=1 Tax=Primulina huaijiensis TaxID=1492673 RepID=UPI003CC70B41